MRHRHNLWMSTWPKPPLCPTRREVQREAVRIVFLWALLMTLFLCAGVSLAILYHFYNG